MFSLPFEPRKVRATEARLNAIYRAAFAGLKGESLAVAAGMHPQELRQLVQLDPAAELAAMQGRADAELAHATKLSEASLAGDAKASLAILQHVHGWTAKQTVEHTVSPSASTDAALGDVAAALIAKIRAPVTIEQIPLQLSDLEDATPQADAL